MNFITTQNGHKSVWTPEKIDMLEVLWEQGATTADISCRLGVTKNAVVGKVHRLGLKKRASPIKHTAEYIESRKRTAKKNRTEQKARAESAATERRSKRLVGTEAETPTPKERVPNGCRWIDGSPQDIHTHGEGIYCNAPKVPGTDWCEAHHERVYIPLSKARRQREKAQEEFEGAPNWNTRHRPYGNGPRTTRRKVTL